MSLTPGPWKFKYHMNIDGIGIMEAEFDVTADDLKIIAAAREMYELLKGELAGDVGAMSFTRYDRVVALLRRIEGEEEYFNGRQPC